MAFSTVSTFNESGSNFLPYGYAVLHFRKLDGSEYPTRTVDIDSTGYFSINYMPPPNKEPGTYTWWAVDGYSGVQSNEISYEVTATPFGPTIDQSPIAGPPGTTFSEWGYGFTPDHDITLHFLKPDGTEYPTLTVHTTSSGYFSISYTAPDNKPEGTYTWWAIDDHTGVSSNSVSYQITNDDPGTVYIQGHTVLVNETWYSGGTYIVQGSVTVAQEATLTIQPGTIVKLNSGVGIYVNGTLKANGTSSNKITFTWATEGQPWNGIHFSGAGSSGSRLEGCDITHARGLWFGCWSWWTYLAAILIEHSSPTITGCTIDESTAPYGIWMKDASPVISGNTISGFTSAGMALDDSSCYSSSSSPTVTDNQINNNGTGIAIGNQDGGTYQGNTISGNTSYGLYYSGINTIDATNCNWVDPSGPLDESDDRSTGGLYNPNGLGNRVSDHVNYYPWIGATAPPVPTGLAGTPEDSAINLTWNAVTDPSLDGYNVYYGTSLGNYGAPVKVGNVTSHKLTQLTNGIPYYIAISSVNFVGAESAKCTEIMVTPNADADKPTSTITQPLNGSNLYTNKLIIKGIADDGAGSGVHKVEVSIDGGSTWNLATGTTSWSYVWTIPGTETYNIKSRATDNASNEETPSAGIMVTVVNRQPTPITINGRKLMVNGNPLTIKGVGYSPVPIGFDPETTSPYGDYFTSDYGSIYDRDLPLLQNMGTNTLRLWDWNNTADHLDFLDKAYNSGIDTIYVIAGFWINPDLDIDPDSPDNVREKLKADFREMVAIHKNHPAILMWAIGNDLNADNMYGGNLDHLFSLINEMAEEAHTEEGSNYHPVITPLVDNDLITTITTYDSLVPSLDIWGANVYRGNTFGTLFNDYKAVTQKPLAILEYGIDAFDNDHGNEYEKIGTPYQADYTEALWKEIEANSDTCIGGSIMAYSDEWYKGEYSTDPGCPDNDSAYHSTCGYPASSDPDEYCNEEWWGIMRTKDNGDNPDVMEPRAVYYRMQSLWVEPSHFVVSGKVTNASEAGIAGVTMSFARISGNGSIPPPVQTDADGKWSQSEFEPGTTYRITPAKTNFIFTPSSLNFSDTRTDLNFNGAKAITIVSPNGGEVWKRRTYHVIQWRFNGNPGPYVRIELLKNGVVNSVIHKSYPKDAWNSRYPWVIPVNQALGKNYRIRITSTFNSSYSDTSNKTFTITK